MTNLEDLETETTLDPAIFTTATEREAKVFIGTHMKSIKIKNNNHVSPNARLAFFRQFNCFDDIKLINEVNSEKIEFKLVRGTEVLANEAAPVAITQKMNDREFKKFNSSLMGRALKNYGILAISELQGVDEDEPEAGGSSSGGWDSGSGKGNNGGGDDEWG